MVLFATTIARHSTLLKDMYALLSDLAISESIFTRHGQITPLCKTLHHNKEKYRSVIGYLIKRLVKTAVQCEVELAALTSPSSTTEVRHQSSVDEHIDGWQDVEPILSAADLMGPLRIMHDSLIETGFDLVADGLLVDIIRRVSVFGMSLVPLDIRE
jgi:phosphoenolpyruvate carboxylase